MAATQSEESPVPDLYVGEIRMFTGRYAPHGWALCDGKLRDVSDDGRCSR